MYEHLLIEKKQTHNELILNRPEKHNALSPQLILELHQALTTLTAEDPKILLLKGAGQSFSSGHDMETAVSLADPGELKKQLEYLQDITKMIVNFPAPVVAALHGYAIGAGCEIALNCDLIYAADDTLFRFPELQIGLSITQGSSYFLQRLAGSLKARELIYFGEPISAELAHELGLVNQVYGRDELYSAVDEKLKALSQVNMNALGHIKKLFNDSADHSLDEALSMEIKTLISLLSE